MDVSVGNGVRRKACVNVSVGGEGQTESLYRR